MNPELQAALDELTEVTRSATEENARRLDRLEADINLKALDPSGRLGGLSGFPDSGGRQAFNKFLRNGREALEPHEAKNLVLSDDTRGGYRDFRSWAAFCRRAESRFFRTRTIRLH